MLPADFTVSFPPPAVVAKPLAGETMGPQAAKPKVVKPQDTGESDEVISMAREYITANEGVRNSPYKDSKGLWTVGIGHLMTPEEIKSIGTRKLSDQEVNDIFARDLNSKVKMVRSKLGNTYDTLPTRVKVAIIDGFFRGDMSGSPKALELIKAGKLNEAADEYLNNREYRDSVALNKKGKPHGVAGRMERNAQALREAAKAKSAPVGRKLSQATLQP